MPKKTKDKETEENIEPQTPEETPEAAKDEHHGHDHKDGESCDADAATGDVEEDIYLVLNGYGVHLLEHADLQGSEAAFTKAHAEAVKQGDKTRQAESLNNLAHVLITRGRADEALTRYDEAMAAAEEAGDLKEIARGHHSLGAYYESCKDYHASLVHLLTSIAFQKRAEIDPATTVDFIWGLKKLLKFRKFSEEVKGAYDALAPDLQEAIDIDEFAKQRTLKLVEAKPGRNEPCPCGSGKKYKKCCGA